jgi:hypothetical protein
LCVPLFLSPVELALPPATTRSASRRARWFRNRLQYLNRKTAKVQGSIQGPFQGKIREFFREKSGIFSGKNSGIFQGKNQGKIQGKIQGFFQGF